MGTFEKRAPGPQSVRLRVLLPGPDQYTDTQGLRKKGAAFALE